MTLIWEMQTSPATTRTIATGLDRKAWLSRLPPYDSGFHGTLRSPQGEMDLLSSGYMQFRYFDACRELVMGYALSVLDPASPDSDSSRVLLFRREWLDRSGLVEYSTFASGEERQAGWISVQRKADGSMLALVDEGEGDVVRRELPPETLMPGEAMILMLEAAIRGDDVAPHVCLHPMDSSHAATAVSRIAPYEGQLNPTNHAAWTFVTSHVDVAHSPEMPEVLEWAVVREDGVVLACSIDMPDMCWSFQLLAPQTTNPKISSPT